MKKNSGTLTSDFYAQVESPIAGRAAAYAGENYKDARVNALLNATHYGALLPVIWMGKKQEMEP